ncbi:hypothetical protein [Actinosynnema sp. NPDC020468]|uniref:hypothetical protein n=1 Tax=Actinosynnema sp. NPDC020468 TaxID=3154488 RepID=UPI0033E75237
MPIRTNRGRAAVYRRLWGWPLRSPRHLVITIVVFTALVLAISFVLPRVLGAPAGPRTQQGAAATTTGTQVGVLPTATGPTTPQPTKAPPPTASGPTVAVPADAQMTAELWVEVYGSFKPGVSTKEKWLADLKKYTSEELFPRLDSIDPANVPAVIKDKIKPVRSVTDSVKFEVPLSNGKLVLTVVKLPEGWRVHQFDKVA